MSTASFILFTSLFILCASVQSSIVYTENGALSGTVYTTATGTAVQAFLGVPFARPPIGEYRFQEPKPVDSWVGTHTAHNFSARCIQYTYYKKKDPIIGKEDCLYLNIFTPNASNDTKLDVIFYIHGGAFMFGGGDMFNPDFILDRHDVVFVSINYRLGPFGFLTTEDGVIPGNNGLKDQVLALKWVQNNIEQFGGDRNRVTIAGLSAGGASVHLHYLSPLSRNLFSKGISLSGSAFCPWVMAENSFSKAKTLGRSVGCYTDNSKELAECLRNKEAKSLLSQTDKLFMPWNFNPFSPFGAVVENDSRIAFLSKNPHELLSEGNVKDAPWLTSITTEEGLYPGASFVTNEDLMRELEEKWNEIAPHLLDYYHTVPQHRLSEVSEKIKKFYLSNTKITLQKSKELTQMVGDRLFVVDIERAARLQASVTKSPVYFYSFAYRGKYSLSDYLCKCKDNLGASHGDDLLYVLKSPQFSVNTLETQEDRAMVNTMVDIWSSFVRAGVPKVNGTDWVPVPVNVGKEGSLPYLLLSSGNDIKLSSSADLGHRKFWDSLEFQELWEAVKERKKYDDEL